MEANPGLEINISPIALELLELLSETIAQLPNSVSLIMELQ